jgi:hypothetical protein
MVVGFREWSAFELWRAAEQVEHLLAAGGASWLCRDPRCLIASFMLQKADWKAETAGNDAAVEPPTSG